MTAAQTARALDSRRSERRWRDASRIVTCGQETAIA